MKSLADLVADLEAERDALLERAKAAEANAHQVGRLMYRRGYLTGRESVRGGRAAHRDPELHARGKTREMLGV